MKTKKSIALSVISIENIETLEHHVFYKTLFLSIIYEKYGSKDEKKEDITKFLI